MANLCGSVLCAALVDRNLHCTARKTVSPLGMSSCALTGLTANSITGTCINGTALPPGLINATALTCTCPEPEFALGRIFIDVGELPAGAAGFIQLLWLFIFYAIVLFQGSNMISDGSELLLLLLLLVAFMFGVVLFCFLGA